VISLMDGHARRRRRFDLPPAPKLQLPLLPDDPLFHVLQYLALDGLCETAATRTLSEARLRSAVCQLVLANAGSLTKVEAVPSLLTTTLSAALGQCPRLNYLRWACSNDGCGESEGCAWCRRTRPGFDKALRDVVLWCPTFR
jgi:hypothetical protein